MNPILPPKNVKSLTKPREGYLGQESTLKHQQLTSAPILHEDTNSGGRVFLCGNWHIEVNVPLNDISIELAAMICWTP